MVVVVGASGSVVSGGAVVSGGTVVSAGSVVAGSVLAVVVVELAREVLVEEDGDGLGATVGTVSSVEESSLLQAANTTAATKKTAKNLVKILISDRPPQV